MTTIPEHAARDWRPGATRDALVDRADLFRRIRGFFDGRGVLEVDTPLIARFGVTDPAIEPLLVQGESDAPRFLQTSPEFAMKRLLAAGSGPIYQLGKAFRDGEVGARHNPEFTLLEWYRPGFTLTDLMQEVAALVRECLRGACEGGSPMAVEYCSYAELMGEVAGIDAQCATESELARAAARFTDVTGLSLPRDGWLDLLMTHAVEASLRGRGMVFVFDYPASQAALARCIERGGVTVADRFELYLDGMEIANGYRELLDAGELRRRAVSDNDQRRCAGQVQRDPDPRLLAALAAGLPDCAGVALGVDRLLMYLRGARRVEEVLPFDWRRC